MGEGIRLLPLSIRGWVGPTTLWSPPQGPVLHPWLATAPAKGHPRQSCWSYWSACWSRAWQWCIGNANHSWCHTAQALELAWPYQAHLRPNPTYKDFMGRPLDHNVPKEETDEEATTALWDWTPKRPSTGTATNTLASGGRALAFPLLQAYREQERSHLCAMPGLNPTWGLSAFCRPLHLPLRPSPWPSHLAPSATNTETTSQALCPWEMEQGVYCAALENIVADTKPCPPCATWRQKDRQSSSFLRGNPHPLSIQRAKKREKCPHLQPPSSVFWPEMLVEESERGSVATLGTVVPLEQVRTLQSKVCLWAHWNQSSRVGGHCGVPLCHVDPKALQVKLWDPVAQNMRASWWFYSFWRF